MDQDSGSAARAGLTRREAIRRAALLAGAAFSPAWLALVDRRASGLDAQSAAAGAAPRFLTPDQFATLAAAADRLLPRTDTPGAADVGVPAFIDLLYGEYMTAAERALLVRGLDAIAGASTAADGPFHRLPVARQDELLRAIARREDEEKMTDGPFRLIRTVTILGYFTSEPVARTVLNYDPVPGRYDACVPVDQVGRRNWN